jgi:hypothetical protein
MSSLLVLIRFFSQGTYRHDGDILVYVHDDNVPKSEGVVQVLAVWVTVIGSEA